MSFNNNDPIKGLIAICEHLAKRGLMTQAEFDDFISKMQNKWNTREDRPIKDEDECDGCGITKKEDTIRQENQSLLYKIKKKLDWDQPPSLFYYNSS